MGEWGDKAEGELKETEGKLTGDEMREKQGQGEEAWADVKERGEDVKEEVEERF